MEFQKSDLVYDDYSSTAIEGDDPKITGKPDSTMFNRHEVYEVLYLINKICEQHGLKKKHSGRVIEYLIHEELPSNIRSQLNVKNWIVRNFNDYKDQVD